MRAVRYALLRSGVQWPNAHLERGLEIDLDGHIALARLPAVSPPFIAAAAEPGFAGAAIDDCRLYLVDGDAPSLVRIDLASGERIELSWAGLGLAGVGGPRGLAIGPHGWLYVAAGAAVVQFDAGLHLRGVWPGFSQASAIACSAERVYVLDAPNSLRCLDGRGNAVPTFSSSLAPTSDIRGMALAPDGTLYVSDDSTGAVLRMDTIGGWVGAPLASNTKPRALALGAGRLHVVDLLTNSILVLALPRGAVLGSVDGYSGTPSGLVVTPDHNLVIKTGRSAATVTAKESASYATTGELLAGPLDAGIGNHWYRVSVRRVPAVAGNVELSTWMSPTKTTGPGPWHAALGDDQLLSGSHRFLWLRLQLSGDGRSTPRLRQVEAETPGESYIKHLPAVYARDDAAAEFLIPFLELARSQLGDLELAIDDLPRVFDPAVAPADALPWLAGWLGFTPPHGADSEPEHFRALLEELPALVRKRGTIEGVTRYIEIEAGVQPHIIEDFRDRGIFALDVGAGLGFDTMLPAFDPDGLVVGEANVGASGPEDSGSWGAGLFEPFAHRFTVLVPPSPGKTEAWRNRVVRTIDEEKPAHALAHICFVQPALKVGLQARIGVDAIVAGRPPEISLEVTSDLGINSRLASPASGSPGVAGHGQVGIDTRLG